MAIRVSPGVEKTHECQGHKKSESRNGTQLAETIMASGITTFTGRTQDSTRPGHAETSKELAKREPSTQDTRFQSQSRNQH